MKSFRLEINRKIAIRLRILKRNIKLYIDNLNKNAHICSLCLNKIHHLSPNVIKLKCGHLYHESSDPDTDCRGIDIWLQKNNSCPECRDVDPKEKKRVK